MDRKDICGSLGTGSFSTWWSLIHLLFKSVHETGGEGCPKVGTKSWGICHLQIAAAGTWERPEDVIGIFFVLADMSLLGSYSCHICLHSPYTFDSLPCHFSFVNLLVRYLASESAYSYFLVSRFPFLFFMLGSSCTHSLHTTLKSYLVQHK